MVGSMNKGYCPKCKEEINGKIYQETNAHYYTICPTCKTKIYVKI